MTTEGFVSKMVLTDIIARVQYKVLKEDAPKKFTGFHCSANQPECANLNFHFSISEFKDACNKTYLS
jgi:hypothetical protein